MEKKVTTKTESKTVETRAKSKTVETKYKAVEPEKKSRFEDALIEYSYSGNCDGYDEMTGYLISLDILNEKQLFLVAVADGVIQDIRPTGIKSMRFELQNVYFRELVEYFMDGFLEEVDEKISDNLDTYFKILEREASK